LTRRLPAELGEVIGGYRLDELLSRGGMGAVYKATHAVLGRTAVVKVLERSLLQDEDYVARFLEEAKIVNGVRHENIVDIFDFVTTENPRRVACIMEYIHGPTLKGALSQRVFSVAQAVNATIQLIGALRAVHHRGVIHRDLKPTNIMVVGALDTDLSRVPSVKILDFGIAKVVDSSSVKTGPGAMLGTPAYMAPEQVSGDEITPATDVYALGELFYEMVSASRLYATGSANQIIKAKVLGEAPPIRLPVNVVDPDAIRNLVHRCLDLVPQHRPTLDELERDLVAIRQLNGDTAPESVLLMDDGGRTAVRPLVEDTSPSPPPGHAPPAPVKHGEPALPPEVRRLGEFYVFAELPARGMTQVFVARKEGRLEICILKRLLHNLENNPTAIARFGREAKIAQHLDHPRIAKLLDASVQDFTFCIASEFIIGETLDAALARVVDTGKTVPLQVVAPLALGILDGLDHAHTATDPSGRPLQIVHRDLTPAAIVLAFAGDVKILDFGVARASVDDFKTSPGMAVGSIEYMSPEQARSLPLDQRSDLYTFSAVLYEILTNRPAVRAGGVLETLKSVTGDRPPPLISIRADLTKELAAVVEKGLEKDPARRWQSAAEYRAALANAFGRFAGSSLDSVGDFLRNVMPEEEQRAVELLARIRVLGEQIPAPRSLSTPSRSDDLAPPNEPTMTVRRRKLAASEPEEIEPSVMTMPGAPAPLERRTAVRVHSVVPAPAPRPPRRPPWIAIGAGTAAVVLLVAAIVASTRTPPELATAPPSTSPAEVTVAPKEAEVEAPEEPEVALVAPPVEQPIEPPVTKKAQRPPPAAKAAPRPLPPPPPPEPAAPPPPPPVVKESEGLSAVKALSKELSLLRANPKDAKLFDKIHREITQASSQLPASGRRRVKVDLDAAERTYDVELLASALNKMALEAAKNR
jgi:serine/threonine-protein kinase